MTTNPEASNLVSTFVRLRADLCAELLPVDDTFWKRLTAGKLGTFKGEYLVSVHVFASDWDVWEMHPNGDEILCLLDGRVTFVLERPDDLEELELRGRGAFAVVPRGVWHTAKVDEPSTVLFITPGEGTQNRKS